MAATIAHGTTHNIGRDPSQLSEASQQSSQLSWQLVPWVTPELELPLSWGSPAQLRGAG